MSITAPPADVPPGDAPRGEPPRIDIAGERAVQFAGMFYPAAPATLAAVIGEYLSHARPPAADAPPPKAIVAPHAGYPYSGPVAASAYALLAPLRGRISRVVLIGPSHQVAFRGLAVDTRATWQTPLGPVPLDQPAIAALCKLPGVGVLDAAYAREHSLEVHVPFLQQVLGAFRLVPIVAGDAEPDAVAAALAAVWGGAETLIVISTDLSHYLDYASAQAKDTATAAAVERLDAGAIGRDDACGRVGLRGLLWAAKRRGMTVARLDLRNSGDTAGPRSQVVGYGAWALFEPTGGAPVAKADPDEAELRALAPGLLKLAHDSIVHGLFSRHPMQLTLLPNLPPRLLAHGAAFVTLRRDGALRGCIGSPQAWRPLVVEVAERAYDAAFRDPRFRPLQPMELEGLEVSISVLAAPEPLRFRGEEMLLAMVRPGIDGLIIEDEGRRALFLPSVWEELPDPRQFLAALKRKAGMPADHFTATFAASRFRAVELKAEEPMQPGAGNPFATLSQGG
jgi:AmmeMemoRadiSam system protein B/AmmeMemoRadiSam system protein A